MIHGIGLDIVDVARFKAAEGRWGERLHERLFTRQELSYCLALKRPEVHLSARFAAKVSFFKAIGRTFRYRDVEVVRTKAGAPELRVIGLDKRFKLSLSISHTDELAMAQTVAERIQ